CERIFQCAPAIAPRKAPVTFATKSPTEGSRYSITSCPVSARPDIRAAAATAHSTPNSQSTSPTGTNPRTFTKAWETPILNSSAEWCPGGVNSMGIAIAASTRNITGARKLILLTTTGTRILVAACIKHDAGHSNAGGDTLWPPPTNSTPTKTDSEVLNVAPRLQPGILRRRFQF